MGKKFCMLMLILLVLGIPVSVAASGATVVLDGATVEFEHELVWQNGRMLVPVRELYTAMGAAVAWDDATRTVMAEMNNVKVNIPLGSYLPTVDAMPVAIDAPATLINGRIYVPLRFAVTSLGGEIKWEAAENTAYLFMLPNAVALHENHDGDSSVTGSGKIDINSACLDNLLTIDGLSEATAAEILACREANGPFRTFAEIKKMPFMTDELFGILSSNIQIAYREEGIACWYGTKFHGRMTSSGEVYDKNLHTAAHRTLPFGTIVKVTFSQTGRSVWVRINDRGPHVAGRIIDLSRAAADAIGLTPHGLGHVELEIIL